MRKFKIESKVWYEVSWEGFEGSTIEPHSSLIADVPILIKEFNSTQKRREAKHIEKAESKRLREGHRANVFELIGQSTESTKDLFEDEKSEGSGQEDFEG